MPFDYSKLPDDELNAIHAHLQAARKIYQRNHSYGMTAIYRAEEEAAAEEQNVRRSQRATDEYPTVQAKS